MGWAAAGWLLSLDLPPLFWQTLIYGNKACMYSGKCPKTPGPPPTNPSPNGSVALSHGALGFLLRSQDGRRWTCDGGGSPSDKVGMLCDAAHPTTVDHDDGSMTFDPKAQQWVNMQIVIQQGPMPRMASGVQLHDNGAGRRVVGFRTSTDGRSWTCVSSCGSAETYENDPHCHGAGGHVPTDALCPNLPLDAASAPVIRPDDRDPPELQFYRARPWRYGDRWVAAAYNYAPWPLCGPHQPAPTALASALADPLRPRWRQTRRSSAATGLTWAPNGSSKSQVLPWRITPRGAGRTRGSASGGRPEPSARTVRDVLCVFAGFSNR